jgi:hypothetical protein
LRRYRKWWSSEAQAIEGKEKNEALFAIAAAYRAFAKDHNELYRVIMGLQKSKNEVLEKAAGQITEPIFAGALQLWIEQDGADALAENIAQHDAWLCCPRGSGRLFAFSH